MINQTFTEKEKKFIMELNQILNDDQKRKQYAKRMIEEMDSELVQWQRATENKYHKWIMDQVKFEEKINNQLYSSHKSTWTETQELLKRLVNR